MDIPTQREQIDMSVNSCCTKHQPRFLLFHSGF